MIRLLSFILLNLSPDSLILNPSPNQVLNPRPGHFGPDQALVAPTHEHPSLEDSLTSLNVYFSHERVWWIPTPLVWIPKKKKAELHYINSWIPNQIDSIKHMIKIKQQRKWYKRLMRYGSDDGDRVFLTMIDRSLASFDAKKMISPFSSIDRYDGREYRLFW